MAVIRQSNRPEKGRDIFFDDPWCSEPPSEDVPFSNPLDRLIKLNQITEEKTSRLLRAWAEGYELVSTYLTALGATRYHNFLVLENFAFRLTDTNSNLVKTFFSSLPTQETEDNVNGSFQNVKNFLTSAGVKIYPQDWTVSAFANSYTVNSAREEYMNLVLDPKANWRVYVPVDSSTPEWFPGTFPATPFHHMTFYRGWSFYVPDGMKVDLLGSNQYFSSGLLICNPQYDVLSITQFALPAQSVVAYGKWTEIIDPQWQAFPSVQTVADFISKPRQGYLAGTPIGKIAQLGQAALTATTNWVNRQIDYLGEAFHPYIPTKKSTRKKRAWEFDPPEELPTGNQQSDKKIRISVFTRAESEQLGQFFGKVGATYDARNLLPQGGN